ncbi:MAG: low specificity L-threonine aldolase [Planctomycetota bacterium]
MHFASDNWAGVADEITAALRRSAGGFCTAYGESPDDRALEQTFNDLFETQVNLFFVGTGTAANALALTAVNRPGGFVFCHQNSHLIEDECGAPEYFTGGARLDPIAGDNGKMQPSALDAAIARFDPSFVHHGQPMAISVTQATECGTVYSIEELQAIAAIAKRHRLPLHMDGARFANALVHLDASPADATWRAGVDLLSFGGTKNGCWCAEALLVFNDSMAESMPYLRKRAAQLFSKTRFITAQFSAYLHEGLWLRLASHANAMAKRLADALGTHKSVRLAWQPQSNEVFVVMPKTLADRLQAAGANFYPWPVTDDVRGSMEPGEGLYRLVTSFATEPSHVDDFVRLL